MTIANAPLARRPLLIGAIAVLGLGAMGLIGLEAPRLLRPRYAPTPFDDLLAKLPDRESATHIGAAVLGRRRPFSAEAAASSLRAHLNAAPLSAVLDVELRQGRTVEVQGWVIPESLATLCALAAKAG